MSKSVYLVASGDLRLAANQNCWPTQHEVEVAVTGVLEAMGWSVVRGHAYDPQQGHGFIGSQKQGMEVFRSLDPDIPIIVLVSSWQYSHHILHGLITHKAPILTLANWSGQWPGLVGMLNLNGSLTKAGTRYSTLWSKNFNDEFFLSRLQTWLETGRIEHDTSHVRPFSIEGAGTRARDVGERVAQELVNDKAIMGVFDEGCMGMFNAIIPDHLLNDTGVFKERLSQSALYYETMQTADREADECRRWLDERGMTFTTGQNEETELTDHQIRLQLKMYIAAVRLADDFGCDAIGIQYQQGLKDLLPASDLAEGLLNNVDRPPVRSRDGGRVLFDRHAVVHFNEVDECAGLDALVTNRVWNALGYPPETTLHDLRWGEEYDGEFVWVFEISGAAPPAHFVGGFAGASSERQPPMYFGLGGGTLKGVSRPGTIVWSRVFVEDDRLKADLGLAKVVALPPEETERRWAQTTSQWPIMHGVLEGVTRDQMMARHKANHIQVAYAPDRPEAVRALEAKAVAFTTLGIETFVSGRTGQ